MLTPRSQTRSRAPRSSIYSPITGRKGDVVTRETPKGKMKPKTVTIVKDQEAMNHRPHGIDKATATKDAVTHEYEVIHWTKITLTLTLKNPKIVIFCK